MKATLEFNLPEDQHDFDLAVNGTKAQSALWEMDQYLRNELKYSDDRSFEDLKLLQEVRDQLREIMFENGLNFE
jgi:hypothetical protein